MILSRVIGNCVSTVQHAIYDGKTVLVVVPVAPDGHTPVGGEYLAVDTVQAGPGDLVLVSREGNAARQVLGQGQPVHSVVLGIVDDVALDDVALEEPAQG